MLKINDSVRVISYDKLPENLKNTGMGRVCNKHGYIVNKLYSTRDRRDYYTVQIDGFLSPSSIRFTEDMLIKDEPATYTFDVIIDGGVSIVRMKDINNNLIAEGHAHIFNGTGAERVAQATSYAAKRLFDSFFKDKLPRKRAGYRNAKRSA